MKKKFLTGKALAAVGAITFVSAGAAAAAGVVPTPFSAPRPSITTSTERVHDDATEDVDADAALDTTTTTDETEPADADAARSAAVETEDTDGQGPDVNGPAKFGLCTAFEARSKHDDTTATEAGATPPAEPVSDAADSELPAPFQALNDAAVTAGQSVADFCATAEPGGSGDAHGRSGDSPSATAPGKSADSPSETAPGKPAGTPGNSGGDHGQPPKSRP